MGAGWPSVYVYKELNLLLVVYADDFNLSGPKGNLKKGWDLLRAKREIEPETGLGLYSGRCQIKGAATLGGVPVNTVAYEVEEVLEMSVRRDGGDVGQQASCPVGRLGDWADQARNPMQHTAGFALHRSAQAPGTKCRRRRPRSSSAVAWRSCTMTRRRFLECVVGFAFVVELVKCPVWGHLDPSSRLPSGCELSQVKAMPRVTQGLPPLPVVAELV